MNLDFVYIVQNLCNKFHLTSLPENMRLIVLSIIMGCVLYITIMAIGLLLDSIIDLMLLCLSKIFGSKIVRYIDIITFPGVMIHELSHALFAILTGAVVTKIKLFTLTDKERLGYVEYMTRGTTAKKLFQHAACACAPTLVGFTAELILIMLLLLGNIKSYGIRIVLMYFIISILMHMSMSRQDLKNYIMGFFGVIIIMIPYMFVLINILIKI